MMRDVSKQSREGGWEGGIERTKNSMKCTDSLCFLLFVLVSSVNQIFQDEINIFKNYEASFAITRRGADEMTVQISNIQIFATSY